MKKILKTGIFCTVFFLLIAGAYGYRCRRLQEDIAKRILRFHILANSNSRKDQELKLKIRDKIGSYLQVELKDADDLAACERIVTANLAQITECAKDVMEEEGFDYPVEAFVADTEFPVKTYGKYTFPGGTYRALKVVLGEGGGDNWWCVMYPNLCFSGSMYQIVEEGADEKLQAVLTEEEYAQIMAEGEARVRLKYFRPYLP